jgi:hypothetical protein
LSVVGKLADGTPFQSAATLPGLNNGARVAFLTKQSGTGNVKGWPGASPTAASARDAADGICQGEADTAGLRGTFVAFLSAQGAYDAGCRAFGLDGLLVNKCGQQQAPVDDAPWLGTTGLPIVDYLSTTATDAVCHILGLTGKVGAKCGLAALPDTDPWRRADNYPIGTAAQLVKSNLTAPVAFAADASLAFDQRPWTGTNSNGSAYTTCGDWTVDDTGTGVCGYGRALTNGWSFFTDANCSFSEPVFCFEK